MLSWIRPYVEGFTQSAAMGALATVRAAVDPDVVGGDFYGPAGLLQIWGHPTRVTASRRARNREIAARLWDVSVDETGMEPLPAYL
jgi:hypothetical protein